MSRLVLGGLALGLLLSSPSAGQSLEIPTDPKSGVSLRVESLLPKPWGSAPLRIVIRNDSGRDRSWTFDYISMSVAGTRRYRSRIAVAAGEHRSFEVVVPLSGDVSEMSSLQMRVGGFGITNSDWQYPMSGYATETTPAPALSLSLHAEAQRGISFDTGLLPSDYRGLLGLSVLALGEDEWNGLRPGAREAISEWTARGGRLVLVDAEWHPGESPGRQDIGLGAIVKVKRPQSEAEWVEVLEASGPPQGVSYRAWTEERFPSIEDRPGFLLAFLLLYAPLVGPVNLYVFCSKGRRARLFWTLPALALGASLLLTAIVLLQDGLGGRGHRVTFLRLVPELTREVLIQEQSSRTGALLSRGFDLDDSFAVYDAPLGLSRGEELASEGSRFWGGWFRSRAIQAQRIEGVRPTRAGVSFVGEGSITSSIEDTLDELYYRDDEGRTWRAAGVGPGARAALVAATEEEYDRFWGTLFREAGPVTRLHLQQLVLERGGFLARAAASSRAVETLEGIVWSDTVIYSGRVVGEAKP
jgi:hypothetical protein